MKEHESVPRWMDGDSDASDELRALLHSSEQDDPSAAELAGVREKLGPLFAEPPPPPATAGANISNISRLWVRLGVGVGLVAGAGIVWTAARVPERSTLKSGLHVAPHVVVASEANPPTAEPASIRTASEPTSPKAALPATSASAPTNRESEIAMLERAHAALRGGRAGDALAVTLEHAKSYPRGLLSQEREVIAIEALSRLGRRSEAESRGHAFIERFPSSSHARRVRSILGIVGDGGS